MPINECCKTDVVCCEKDATVGEVAALMRSKHVGDVVITEDQDGKRIPVGIVTDRDIVIGVVAPQLDANVITAGDVMSTPVSTVRESDGFVETLRIMREHKVRRLPVVTDGGALFGIVTADDIVKILTVELSMMSDTIVEQPLLEARLRR